jgi:hypothetical protein
VDASEAMVAKLRAKAGCADMPMTIGDFAELDIEGEFSLVYVAFNTFFALLSQKEQVRRFSNVTRRLREGVVFVIEAFVPDMTRWDRDQRIETRHLGGDSVVLDAARHDPVEQRVASTHLVISQAGVKLYPVRLLYSLAFGAGSHGSPGGSSPARALGRLAPGTVYGVERQARLGLRARTIKCRFSALC